MTRFLSLLENGEYRTNREVSWYADKLCITPKYLSQVCKEVSGCAANYWINRYTILDIAHLLRDKSLSFVQISDQSSFSSPAYFSRYVQRYLGTNPTAYRGCPIGETVMPSEGRICKNVKRICNRGITTYNYTSYLCTCNETSRILPIYYMGASKS